MQSKPWGRFGYYHVSDGRVVLLLDLGISVFQDHLDGVATCRVVQPMQGTRLKGKFSFDATEEHS